MQKTLVDQGLETGSASELESLIRQHVQHQLREGMLTEQSQKTNLEESNYLDLMQDKKDNKKHKKHHKKAKHQKKEKKVKSKSKEHKKKSASNKKAPPATSNLMNTRAVNANDLDKQSQTVDVPIDETKAITLKVAPTWKLDNVESVTLKSFRKIVGYDTFDAIRKADRDEKKDPADYYNITVSMMVKRRPDEKATAPAKDPYDGKKSLADTLDKGFPYDDGDINLAEAAPRFRQGGVSAA